MKIIIISIISSLSLTCYSQSIDRNIYNSASGSIHLDDINIEYSIGETITNTITTNETELTQGFIQPIIIKKIQHETVANMDCVVYPNPTQNYIIIKPQQPLNANIKIYDNTGKIIINQHCKIIDTYEIDLSSMVTGVYFMIVEDNSLQYKQKFTITLTK